MLQGADSYYTVVSYQQFDFDNNEFDWLKRGCKWKIPFAIEWLLIVYQWFNNRRRCFKPIPRAETAATAFSPYFRAILGEYTTWWIFLMPPWRKKKRHKNIEYSNSKKKCTQRIIASKKSGMARKIAIQNINNLSSSLFCVSCKINMISIRVCATVKFKMVYYWE